MNAKQWMGDDDRDTLGRNKADDKHYSKPYLGWCKDCNDLGVLTPATDTWDFDYCAPVPVCALHFRERDNFEPTDAQREARSNTW